MALSNNVNGIKPLEDAISVVVCTFRRPLVLERCLASISELTLRPAAVIVVDNAPINGDARLIAEGFGAQYAVAPTLGVSRARNLGLKMCASGIVAYVDDNKIVHPGWLGTISAAFAHKEVTAVTGPVLPPEALGASDDQLEKILTREPWGPHPFLVSRKSKYWLEQSIFGGLGDGNMSFRKSALGNWTGFDEAIGRGAPIGIGEEHYAYFELLRSGRGIQYAPTATMFRQPDQSRQHPARQQLTDSLAFAGYVATRHPQFAPRIVWYLLGGMMGLPRSWNSWRKSGARNRVRLGELPGIVHDAFSLLAGARRAARKLRSAPI